MKDNGKTFALPYTNLNRMPHVKRTGQGPQLASAPSVTSRSQRFLGLIDAQDYPGAPVEELAAVFQTEPEVPSESFQYHALMLPSERMNIDPGEAA